MPNKNSIESEVRAIVRSSFYVDDGATMHDTMGDENRRTKQVLTLIQREVKKGKENSSTCISPNCDNYVGGYCGECNRLWET